MDAPQRGPFPFDAPFPWSLLKLELLEKYANALGGVLGSRGPICFVDLMAGEGFYSSGDAGSAGRLATIASNHAASGRQVRVIAIESHRAAFNSLKKNTEHVRKFIDVRHAHWEKQVPGLLNELAGEFAFIFIDPMGIRQIPWHALASFVSRPSTELLVNFNSGIAARLAGLSVKGKPVPALDAAMGDDGWKEGVKEALDRHTTHNHMAAAYQKRLAHKGNFTVSSSPVAKDGDQGQHKYHLMFASRNVKAFEIVNDILAAQREEIRRSRALQEQLPLFPVTPAQYDEERVAGLVSALAESLASDPTLRGWQGTIQELRQRAFLTRFASFKFMLYAAAVTLLVEQHRATVIGEEKRRGGKLQLSVSVRL